MRKNVLLALLVLVSLCASAASTTIWYGYYHTTDTREGLGTGKVETYNAASFFKSNIVAGKTIKAIRFYLQSNTEIKNMKVWLSKSLPTSADAADITVQTVNLITAKAGNTSSNVGTENILTLTNPYTVGSEGVYVGYSYTIKDATSASTTTGHYPIVVGASGGTPNGLYLMFSSTTKGAWEDDSEAYGDLAIQLQLEGDFATNSVDASDFDDCFTAVDGSTTASVKVTNTGISAVNSISVDVSVDDQLSYTQSYSFNSQLSELGSSSTVDINIPASSTVGKHTITAKIAKVNGSANESASAVSKGVNNTVAKTFDHRVAVEEFTGTWCGWCPRGLQGMENMKDMFGDKFVGVALHSSDPMAIGAYGPVSASGYPSSFVERSQEADPYYEAAYYVKEALKNIAEVGVEVSGTWNNDKTAVDASATVEAVADGYSYDIEYVLVGDDIHSSDWAQRNYYASYYDQSFDDEDMRKFCSGGTYGSTYFYDWHFNDVALSSSYYNNVNQATSLGELKANSPVISSYTISMSTSTTLLPYVNYDKIYIIALVVNKNTGKIVNAAKSLVSSSSDINIIKTDESTSPVSHYTVDGQKVDSTHKGLTIIRYADGKVKKVLK